MLLGSLTPCVILLTVGFQTASAIVMALADTVPIKFYYDIHNGHALTWTNRDDQLGKPQYSLLLRPDGIFQVHSDESIRQVDDLRSALSWKDIENHLYFDLSALKESGSQGLVYCRLPQPSDDPGAGFQETSSSMRATGGNGNEWGKITYNKVENIQDKTGSSYVQATVSGLPVVFYDHPDSSLKLLHKPAHETRYWVTQTDIVPLNSGTHVYVAKAEKDGLRRVYQSPIDQDPSWKDIQENLYVAKADFEVRTALDFRTGYVIDGSEMDNDHLRDYLKVEFGREGSSILNSFLGKWCCTGGAANE